LGARLQRFKYGIIYPNSMVKNNNYGKAEYSLRERILKLLIENKREWTILEIAKELGVDYKNTFQAMGKLSPLVDKRKKGNLNLVKIKMNSDLDIFNVEKKRTRDFLIKDKMSGLVKEDIEKLNYPFFIVLIFGSIVRGKFTDKSDVDICIISDNLDKTKELISKIRLLPQKIEIHDFTTDEFVSMLDKTQNNLSKEIIKENIILFGVENYYNLVSKWMKKE